MAAVGMPPAREPRDPGDPVSRHRSQGRPVRAPQAGRDGRGHCLQRRSRGAGPRVPGPGLPLPAHRRPQRRVCRQAGERAGGGGDPFSDFHPRAARRRHPRSGNHRGLARQGHRARDPRHRRRARSRPGAATPAGAFPAASPSASTPAAARSRSKAGPRPASSPRSISRAASRTPALPPSSTPTSIAMASSRASTCRQRRSWRARPPFP